MQKSIYDSFFSFFGLRENPFTVNPDPRYLFVTWQIQNALDELTYGIQTRKGIMLLTGEVGTGKTTVINRLLDGLHQQHTPTAFIFNSQLEISHLFDFMLADFGVPPYPELNGNALMRLNQWLFKRYSAGETPVLIVDEAQGMPIHVLEWIRMLLNLETSHEKLLQIVLAGQPELEEKLKRLELRQLKQRIAVRCKTAALTLDQTHDYIRTRLEIAGANGQQIFASQAMDAVHSYSLGIPRVMNVLCEHALINAYADNMHLVPANVVEEIAHEFQFDKKPLGRSIDFSNARNPHSIADKSVLLESSTPVFREVAPYLIDKPDAVVSLASAPLIDASSTTKLPNQHGNALAGPKEPILSSHPAVIPSAPIHRLTVIDGSNKEANRVSEMNVASSRQLKAEPAASQPRISRSSLIRSAGVKKASDFGGASPHTWTRIFDKRAFRRLVTDVKSRVVCGTRRLSVVFLRRRFGYCGSVRREVGHLWQRMAELLVRWHQLPLVQRHPSNAQVQNPRSMSLLIPVIFSRRLHRSWHRWRHKCLSVAPRTSRLSVKLRLVRWLRQPIRPFHLRQSIPK